MGIRSFLEDAFRIRISPSGSKYSGMNISKEKEDITYKQIKEAENGSIVDAEAVGKFRTLSQYREERYSQFEQLLKDATIAAAIEMYADDATQYNYQTGKIIWAESDDENVAKAANRLIDVLQINQKAWQHIYALVAYGDVYLRLYREGDKSDYAELYGDDPHGGTTVRVKVEDDARPLEEYVEYVDDPATMYDLQIKDKTCGFIRMINQEVENSSSMYMSTVTKTLDTSDVNMYDRRAFVHIALEGNIDRHPELIQLRDGENTEVYKVKTGKSILADAYEASQTVKLLEDSMMLSRLTKSALVRILQIEVGNMPKPEVEALLRRTKNMLEQKMAMNSVTGTVASYNSPGPVENIIYVPVRDGKGSITPNNLGGDVNIKDIVDIDYFNNKKLSALKIPKQYLNYDAPEGLGNGTSLTKLSSRYAHTIMRVQNAYISGITNLINLFFIDKCDIVKKKQRHNLNDLRKESEEDKNFIDFSNYINNFTIKMVSPATIEDTERDEQISSRLDQADRILSMIEGKIEDKGVVEVTDWILKEFLHLPDIANILDEYKATHDEDIGVDDDTDMDISFHGGGGGPSLGGPSLGGGPDLGEPDMDMGGSEDMGDTNMSMGEPSITPEA